MKRFSVVTSLAFIGMLTASAQTNTYPFPSSGNVGIGTNSPSEKLTVTEGGFLLNNQPSLSFNAELSSAIRITAAGSWARGYGIVNSQYQTKVVWGALGLENELDYAYVGPGFDSPWMTFKASGSVGVGTTNPLAKLHVRSTGDASQILWNGMFQNPINEAPSGYGVGIRLQNGIPEQGPNEPHKWAGIAAISNGPWSNKTDLTFYTNNFDETANTTSAPIERVRILANTGNVGIGTTNPTHKLAVNGTIKAKEVIVETTGWSDYVFADDYALQPLAEVEAHIKANKHLPGIPSAAQVATEGVSVGELQAKLLAKIEELTLHQIAQEKELASLRQEVSALREKR